MRIASLRVPARLFAFALVAATAGCHVPPPEEVVAGKACDEDAGHACAPGYLCCRGTCVAQDAGCCQPEADPDFCARLGKTCDAVSGADNCGLPRTASCGACTGSATCGGGGLQNVCGVPGCTSESSAAFCARLGKACGPVVAADNCGVSRTVSCGTCTAGVCYQNQCCGDSDLAFCARAGKNCGTFTGTDACGQPRTADCGSCPAPESCGPNNVCTCTPESDAAFCSRHGKQCGSYTNTDNCGRPRTANCGACSTPPNTTCSANTCVCTPQTDADFCAARGVQCGTATGADNCGVVRTASCSACPAPSTCGGGGLAGQCGCIAVGTSDCSKVGAVCCGGICNGSRCCRPLGDACTGGISGECCQASCDPNTLTCCKPTGGCTSNTDCCSGICDVDNRCLNP